MREYVVENEFVRTRRIVDLYRLNIVRKNASKENKVV